jgi:hypothetical protein
VAVPVRRDRAPRALRRAGPGLTLAVLWGVLLHAGPLADDRISDLFVYSQYAAFLGDGLLPYRDFGFEYPPLALLPIGLGGGSELRHSLTMLACALGLQEAARAIGGARAAWACLALLLAGALLRTRFDLLPAALAVGGLALVLRGRPALAGAVLGLGALAKLWPGLLVLVALAWLPRRAGLRMAAAGTIVVCLGVLPFAALSPSGFVAQFEFHLDRPVQIESLPATALFALGGSSVTGDPVRPDRFKSNGLDGGPADLVARLAAVGQLTLLGLVLGLVHRRRGDPDALLLGALAATLAFVALGKVLSPQYLVWLLGVAALVRGTPAALVAAAALATLAYFPDRYFDLVAEDGTAVALVAARNLILLLALAATARALARSRPRAAAASSG